MEDYSPAVRKLLEENRLDPKSIPATGPNQRLTKQDVDAFLARGNGKEQVKETSSVRSGYIEAPRRRPRSLRAPIAQRRGDRCRAYPAARNTDHL